MRANTVIAASEAKAKFSELLDRVQSGESFSITLHGEEAAKLVPARRPSPDISYPGLKRETCWVVGEGGGGKVEFFAAIALVVW